VKPTRLTIALPELLRDVVLAPPRPPAAELQERTLREREQAAYERGRREAEQALQAELLRQRDEFSRLQSGVLDALRQAVPQVVRDSEQALAALCLEVAQKLVADFPLSAELVTAAVQEALAQVGEASEHQVYLHPEDLELLQQANSPLLAPASGGRRIQFHAAPEVTRGGCLVKTRFGVVDGRRETKLELMQKALLA
jgi:flagellar assembly protein FliH